jgi:hypothetical protein
MRHRRIFTLAALLFAVTFVAQADQTDDYIR